MIVVAIIGVLAAIALPQYREYVIRSQISEALLLTADCKLKMTEVSQIGSNFTESDYSSGAAPGGKTWEDIVFGCDNTNNANAGITQYVLDIRPNIEGAIDINLNVVNIPEIQGRSRIVLIAYDQIDATQPIGRSAFWGDSHRPIKMWKCGVYKKTSGINIPGPDFKYLPAECRQELAWFN